MPDTVFSSKRFAKHLFHFAILIAALVAAAPVPVRATKTEADVPAGFRAQFLQLCDAAARKVADPNSRGPYFVDSYAVRGLCAAYDMTGDRKYLDACRTWSDRMVGFQERMTPPGAYYMHYNRKPGETKGDWYAADSSSIAMAIVATSVRCDDAERKRLLDSARRFADLVIGRYVRPSGGVTDGLWSKSDDEWWCSTALFGSFSFVLYSNTGDERYLHAGLAAAGWLSRHDLTADQPFPLVQQGPAMLMYVMECFSAGRPHIERDAGLRDAANAKIAWCFRWIDEQQKIPPAERRWPPTTGWGLKFGGLPFHQYLFARAVPADEAFTVKGDAEMRRLAKIVFDGKLKLTQLPMFMMMSYAERLEPGAIYRSAPH